MCPARRTIPITGILFLAAALAGAGQGVWTSSSPVVSIRAVAADASVDGLVYAASDTTVFVSRDGGASWTAGESSLHGISTLVADPATPLHVFAGTELGVFRSPDAGAHFAAGGPPEPVRAIAVDRTGTTLLYSAGNGQPPVRRSTDGGTTWSNAAGPFTAGRIAALLFRTSNEALVVAGLEGDMSYYPAVFARSANFGRSWSLARDVDAPGEPRALRELGGRPAALRGVRRAGGRRQPRQRRHF
jgi:hypothetical protein